ncbi:hypothetical protein M2132_000578 [Dysgonomonas sp. PH5-45]|uniref:hypothetical protein n=1 Tax=unclassified Dysgonomonas TaxID=2630389 RepID=UPI002476CE50|nr:MULTISPECIES: hypothetical protein [unclassified Dysgonomonas]MDH6354251.1 hypothetical protein [Dysgonomonas sp. PH5-45]MDH6387152.1 hypothetical protein [Dysgonomonas sp. PH5-37]
MSKKIIALGAILFFITTSIFAQLPYAKMMDLTNAELKEKKFKYDSNKNQYKMSKTNKTNQTMNVLSAIGGSTADIKPHKEDYTIVIQKGAEDKTAFTSVLFYNDDTYHTISSWIVENDITPIETNSGKLVLQKFDYEDYTVELAIELVSVKTTTSRTFAAAKSFDESYNVYTYTIYTGVAPESKWHKKEAEKKAKKKLKGDKEDLNDLM